MNKNLISLGPDCHVAGLLNDLNLRKQSLPFDFLLTNSELGIKYVSDLINNNFSDYLENLTYNNNNKVYSKNYPNTVFLHHDLIANKQKLVKSLHIDHLNMDEPLINKFKRRSERFINLINDKNNFNLFFYHIHSRALSKKFYETLDNFVNIMKYKSNNQYLLIILLPDLNNDDIKIKIDYNNKMIRFHSFEDLKRQPDLYNVLYFE
jgi:hypothetical protein